MYKIIFKIAALIIMSSVFLTMLVLFATAGLSLTSMDVVVVNLQSMPTTSKVFVGLLWIACMVRTIEMFLNLDIFQDVREL